MEDMIYDFFENLNPEISDSTFSDLLQMEEDFRNDELFFELLSENSN
jgi:hypothetical protein